MGDPESMFDVVVESVLIASCQIDRRSLAAGQHTEHHRAATERIAYSEP